MKLEKQQFVHIIKDNTGIIKSLCKVYYATNEDQNDAFQDIVLQLWNSFDTFKGKSKISTWIYRVSLNTILHNKRRDKHMIAIESLDTPHQAISTANADDSLELLHMIIQSLKDIDKAIVVLHLEGFRSKEIAEILKISPSNVTTRFNRLKAQLKIKFNKVSCN